MRAIGPPLLLVLSAVWAGCAGPQAPAAGASIEESPFVDRFNMTVRGAGTSDTCLNAVPIDPPPMVAVNRPGAAIRFEFDVRPQSGSLQGGLQIEIATEDNEVLAAGVDAAYVVLDLIREDLAADARMVKVIGRVCDSEAGILDVEAAVSFFAGEIPAEYSAL